MRIPKSQCFNFVRLQKFFSFCVVTLLIWKTMLAAVEFNRQFRFLAKEIKVVSAHGMLAAEFIGRETPSAQPAPDKLFRPRFYFAKLPGAFDFGHNGNLGNDWKTEKLVFSSPSS